MRTQFRGGTAPAQLEPVPRKLLIVLAAILVPGGFIALFGALALKALQKSQRGREVIALAQKRAPAWATSWASGALQRQAA